jgi:hypothetical protein
MSVKDLISAAFNKDASSFESTLQSVMQEKMAAAIQSRFSPAMYEEEVELEEAKASEDDEDEEDEDEEDQLDELSKKTLGSYTRKAASSMGTAAYDLAKKQSDADEVDRMTNRNMPNKYDARKQMKKALGADDDSQQKNRRTIGNRMKGIDQATNKLSQ